MLPVSVSLQARNWYCHNQCGICWGDGGRVPVSWIWDLPHWNWIWHPWVGSQTSLHWNESKKTIM